MKILTDLNVLGSVDLNQYELKNVALQNLSEAPASPVLGQVYFATVTNKAMICVDAVAKTWQPLNDVELGNDVIDATHIDWGTGTNQVSAADIPIEDALEIISGNNIEAALAELKSAIDLNTAKVSNATHTGDVTGSTALTIGNNKVTNAKLATMPAYTIKGNATVAAVAPQDLTTTALKIILNYTKSDLGLSNVTNDAQIKKRSSSTPGNIPAWSDANGDTFDDGYSVDNMGVLSNDDLTIPTSGTVKGYVDALLGANDAMIFKGTVGTGGTLSVSEFNALTTYSAGWTYKVITAGVYGPTATLSCEAGDLIVAIVDRNGSGNLDDDWTVVQNNLDGAVITSDLSPTSGEVAVFNGTTGKVIKGSGITFDDSGEIAGNQVFDLIDVENGLVKNLRSRALTPASIGASPDDHTHSIYTRKYSTGVGDGAATSFVITHNLGTKAVTVQVYRSAAPYDTVYADVERTTDNSVTLKFAEAPASNEYTVVVIG